MDLLTFLPVDCIWVRLDDLIFWMLPRALDMIFSSFPLLTC